MARRPIREQRSFSSQINVMVLHEDKHSSLETSQSPRAAELLLNPAESTRLSSVIEPTIARSIDSSQLDYRHTLPSISMSDERKIIE